MSIGDGLLAKPTGKENGGWAGTPAPMAGKKTEFSSPDTRSGLRCPFTLYTPSSPVGFASLPVFCIVVGVGRI